MTAARQRRSLAWGYSTPALRKGRGGLKELRLGRLMCGKAQPFRTPGSTLEHLGCAACRKATGFPQIKRRSRKQPVIAIFSHLQSLSVLREPHGRERNRTASQAAEPHLVLRPSARKCRNSSAGSVPLPPRKLDIMSETRERKASARTRGRDAPASAPESAFGRRGESPLQVNVTCNRLQLRRGDTGWGAAGGEWPVRRMTNSIRSVWSGEPASEWRSPEFPERGCNLGPTR